MPFPYLSCFFPSVFWIPWYILFGAFYLRSQNDPGWTPLLVLTFLWGAVVCVCQCMDAGSLSGVIISQHAVLLLWWQLIYFQWFSSGDLELLCRNRIWLLVSVPTLLSMCVHRESWYIEITSVIAKIRQWGRGEQQQNLASCYSCHNSIWIFPKYLVKSLRKIFSFFRVSLAKE